MQAFIYLLHFDEALSGRASHYVGASRQIRNRLTRHANGGGSAIMRELCRQGIGWKLGNLWNCTLARRYEAESWLKAQHNASRFCQICQKESRYPISGAREYDIGNLPFVATSEGLKLPEARPERVTLRRTREGESLALLMMIQQMMTADKIALGFIPINGEEGLNVLIDKGQVVIAEVNGELAGYTAFTQVAGVNRETVERVRIQQAVVRDESRLGGVGRMMIDMIEETTQTQAMQCNVRHDLPANGFWQAVGFERIGQFRHATSGSVLMTWRKERKKAE